MLRTLRRLRGVPARLDALATRAARAVLGPQGSGPTRAGALVVAILALAARDRWRWRTFRPLERAPVRERGVLLPAGPGISLGPRLAFEDRAVAEQRHVRRVFPDVRYHRLADASVDAYASSALVGDLHVLPDWVFAILSAGRIKGGSLIHQGATRALHRFPRRQPEIARAIHLGGYHAFNWYHWVAEVLPRVTLLDRLPPELQDHPLLVPPAVARPGTLREALEALCPDRTILPFPDVGPALVHDLVLVDELVLHPPGFAPGHGPSTERDLMHVAGMAEYRRRLREALGVRDGIEPGLRVFIDRDHDPERGYNREELLAIAAERGFVPVVGGNLSLREQAELFARAELVIGPNGAGWTDVLFCSPGARGLCWLVPDGFGGPWFRNLGHLAGVELSYLAAEPRGEGNPLKVDYHVDPDRFAAALDEVVAGW